MENDQRKEEKKRLNEEDENQWAVMTEVKYRQLDVKEKKEDVDTNEWNWKSVLYL